MTEPDEVPHTRIFERHNGAVEHVKNGTGRIQAGKTHVLQRVGPMSQEDEQEKQFVLVGVDKTGPSSSLQRNGIDNVECRFKDCLVDVEVGKHHPLVPLEEVLKDVVEERNAGFNILSWMVLTFISNGVSLLVCATN